jgi:antitoxin ParD1/3/4/toxin ParE1/3/4
LGHRRDDLTTEPLRFWCVYSYLIAYRPDTKPLQIIRIVHGARELGRLFGNP